MAQSRTELALDLLLMLAAAGSFAALAMAIANGSANDFDLAVREGIHEHASVGLTYAMKALTNLGGAWVLWLLGAVVVAALIRDSRVREAALFVIAVMGAEVVNESMKLLFHRPRPEAYFGYPAPGSFSFPSGHSLVSYCFYLALAEILVNPEWHVSRKAAIWGGAVLLITMIGFSRIYLGVHYPTDVIGGYTAAVAWTAMLRAVHQR